MKSPKPPPRAVGVELVQDISGISRPLDGFLRLHRLRVKTLLENETRTETYSVDFVDRGEKARDAVVVLPYAPPAPDEPIGATRVLFRRQLRYPAFLVTGQPLWTEAIAGIIEHPETPHTTAVRELREETGIEVKPDAVRPVGRPFFPLAGAFTERIYPFVAEVEQPMLDAAYPFADSEMEEGAELVTLSLSDAMVLLDKDPTSAGGELFIWDAKTEILLHRLQSLLHERRP